MKRMKKIASFGSWLAIQSLCEKHDKHLIDYKADYTWGNE